MYIYSTWVVYSNDGQYFVVHILTLVRSNILFIIYCSFLYSFRIVYKIVVWGASIVKQQRFWQSRHVQCVHAERE